MQWTVFICTTFLGLCLAQVSFMEVNKEKCNKNGGPGTHDKVEAAHVESNICAKKVFDGVAFDDEINEAKQNGTVGEVVKKYVPKFLQVGQCWKKKLEIIRLCLTKEEIKYYDIFIGILENLLNYVLENDAQRMAAFIENGGVECLQSNIEGVRTCFGDNSATILHRTTESCNQYDKIRTCVVQEIQTNCTSSVPASIVGDIFKFTRPSICPENKIIRHKRSLRRVVRQAMGVGNKLPHIEKALKDSCRNEEAKLNHSFAELKTCVGKKHLFRTPRDEYISNLDACSKDVIKQLDNCLPEKLRYFPRFLFRLVESLIRLLYDDFREIALGLGPCVQKLKSSESEADYNRCIEKVGENNDDTIPESQAAFCEKFLPITKCFTKQINDTCTPNKDLDKFIADYGKAMERPCSQ